MEDNTTIESLNHDIELSNAYFENMNLNEDLKHIYEVINDDEVTDECDKKILLTQIRNDNHRRFFNLPINRTLNLPIYFKDIVNDIKEIYNFIDSKKLLEEDYESAISHKKLLNTLERKFNRLNSMMRDYLENLTHENDERQSIFNISYFNSFGLDEKRKNDILNKYSTLMSYTINLEKDLYKSILIEKNRKKCIDEILELLKDDSNELINKDKNDKLTVLNNKILNKIMEYQDKLYYLQDLMKDNSKYRKEYTGFLNFYNQMTSYDSTNYEEAKTAYEILCDDLKFNILIKQLEDKFIKENEEDIKEDNFIYQKVGIKNIKKSLDYITANYTDSLSKSELDDIEYIYNELNKESYNLYKLNKKINYIVKKIWAKTITNIYTYETGSDFYFICSNNQFIDERYQTILISKKELDRVDDYSDFQIGFIVDYNNNILYITENDDIMSADDNDMSYLKTPIQIEQEFINFKVCNRIALNGYISKISAVYYIDDGNSEKYLNAATLANENKLPLIVLKKSE